MKKGKIKFLINAEETEWAVGCIEEMIFSIPEEVEASNVAAMVIQGLSGLLYSECGYSVEAIQSLVTEGTQMVEAGLFEGEQ